MKKQILALLIASAAVAYAQVQTSPELILMEDFEPEIPEQTKIEGWQQNANVSWEEEAGNYFLRLKNTEPGKMAMAYKEIHFPVGVEAMELSWKQRVSGLVPGEQPWFDARIMLEFMDRDRGAISQKPTAPNTASDTSGWVERTVRFDVPPNAGILKFMPTLLNVYSGTLDLDDIVLKPIPPISGPASLQN